MTHKYLIGCAVALTAASLSSCIREEAANAECDITGVDSAWVNQLYDSHIIRSTNYFVSNNALMFFKEKDADCSSLAPIFTLTPGATINPANGTVRDFSEPQTYTVTAEDGVWKKDYTVSFILPLLNYKQDFARTELGGSTSQYENFLFSQDVTPEPGGVAGTGSHGPDIAYLSHIWASGNGGYAFTGMAKSPEDYPTFSSAESDGNTYARLETKATGSFGEAVNMRIAAGNLFIGEFREQSAMLYPRRATRFGLQILQGEPRTLQGKYKYTAGPDFTDETGEIRPEMHDTCDIYAVVYEVDPRDFVPLNGDDVLSSDRIVLMARIDDPGEPQEWTHFAEPFKAKNGKTFDPQRLEENGYAIAIVITSSRQGAYFRGSVGSVLMVDDIEVTY